LIASKALSTQAATSVRVRIVKPQAPEFDETLDFPAGTTGADVCKAFADRLVKAGHEVVRVDGSKCLFVLGVTEYDAGDARGVIEVTFGQSEGARRVVAEKVKTPRSFKYRGWIESDRWGGVWLANGVHAVKFDSAVESKAKPFVGKSVELLTAPLLWSGPERPTIDVMESITPIARPSAGVASLALGLGSAQVAAAGTLAFRLRLGFAGEDAIEWRQRDLRVLVRRVGGAIPMSATLDLRDRDGLRWAADGTSTDVSDTDDARHDTQWVLRAPGEELISSRKGWLYDIGLLLSGFPKGSYEIWATFQDVNLSDPPGVRADRLAFDVFP
jgi:hypothetical protein